MFRIITEDWSTISTRQREMFCINFYHKNYVKIKVKLSEHSNNNKAAFDNFWGVFLMLLALRDSWDIPTYLNAKFPFK